MHSGGIFRGIFNKPIKVKIVLKQWNERFICIPLGDANFLSLQFSGKPMQRQHAVRPIGMSAVRPARGADPNYCVPRLLRRSGCRENKAIPIAISASSTADAM